MSTPARTIEVGPQGLRIEDLLAVSIDGAPLALSTDAAFQARIAAGAQHLERMLADGGQIYGVTTGYGDSCTVGVPPELVAELPLHLTRYTVAATAPTSRPKPRWRCSSPASTRWRAATRASVPSCLSGWR